MNEAVARAVEEIRATFPDLILKVEDDGQGGAWILLEDVPIGPLYLHATSWIGFRITFQYPYADVYPHFVRSDLVRRDGRSLGDAISAGHAFMGRSALQLSRRSNRLDPSRDTAALKLLKVLSWLETHP